MDILASALASEHFGVNLTISTTPRNRVMSVHKFPNQFWMIKLALRNINWTQTSFSPSTNLAIGPVNVFMLYKDFYTVHIQNPVLFLASVKVEI